MVLGLTDCRFRPYEASFHGPSFQCPSGQGVYRGGVRRGGAGSDNSRITNSLQTRVDEVKEHQSESTDTRVK